MDYKQIQIIIKDFEKSSLASLELEFDNVKIKLSKENTNVQHPATQISTPKQEMSIYEEKNKIGYEVKSPLVGTYYASTSPDTDPFVKVGKMVNKGDTLCIIEAMKIMNEITAPISGKVIAIDVANGEAIGFEQVLMLIDDAK